MIGHHPNIVKNGVRYKNIVLIVAIQYGLPVSSFLLLYQERALYVWGFLDLLKNLKSPEEQANALEGVLHFSKLIWNFLTGEDSATAHLQ